MLKTLTAISFATAVMAAPAYAQGEDQLNAPVAPVLENLPSSGLGEAAIVGGVAAAGVIGIIALAAGSDNDDSTTTTTTSTVTSTSGT